MSDRGPEAGSGPGRPGPAAAAPRSPSIPSSLSAPSAPNAQSTPSPLNDPSLLSSPESVGGPSPQTAPIAQSTPESAGAPSPLSAQIPLSAPRVLSALRALHAAVRAETLRAPRRAAIGIAIPLSAVVLVAVCDAVVGGGGAVAAAAMPLLLAVMLVSLPLGGLAARVADARERGVLRLLATTPAPRGALIVAHTPGALGAGAIVIAAALVALRPDPGRIPAVLAACAGLLLFGVALASVVAAAARTQAAARACAVILPAVVMLTSGVLPLGDLVPWLDRALGFVPTSLLVGALGEALGGGAPGLAPVWILLPCAALAWAVAVRFCRDGTERAQSPDSLDA